MMNVKRGVSPLRRVWHIGPDAPAGRYIDADAPAAAHVSATPSADDSGPAFPGWALSSYELHAGLDVIEYFGTGLPEGGTRASAKPAR